MHPRLPTHSPMTVQSVRGRGPSSPATHTGQPLSTWWSRRSLRYAADTSETGSADSAPWMLSTLWQTRQSTCWPPLPCYPECGSSATTLLGTIPPTLRPPKPTVALWSQPTPDSPVQVASVVKSVWLGRPPEQPPLRPAHGGGPSGAYCPAIHRQIASTT